MGEPIQALIERLYACEGGDRELDADILVEVEGGEVVWHQANYTMEMYPVIKRPSSNHARGFSQEPCPVLTSSLDAVVGLAARAIPGWDLTITVNAVGLLGKGGATALAPETAGRGIYPAPYVECDCVRPPAIALLITVLKAVRQTRDLVAA